ncbi:gamma-glutamylcyclotransferase [Mangrovimonas sp. YM274]|uniref:gamma-glutamylcyclotransferase family protein n=1 Tax=Mangrovimonas sp. YM274 TaxID=3070660 RepID=UPI0027DBAB21|nr:gamma-glutamylcyclotransferase family protein [Mangrovimonas sp. YM274]WMI68683.1 gamma-glutamylcyclotransferase family protein [Mangrovimonas sp. YM274]
MTPLEKDYLFVYGTLLKDTGHEMSRFLLEHAQWIGDGYFYGKLFKVDNYPGAILSDDSKDKVFGSIYQLSNTNRVFEVLDSYEGIDPNSTEPDLYKRMKVDSHLEDGNTVSSWVYIYNLDTEHLEQIHSGNYLTP